MHTTRYSVGDLFLITRFRSVNSVLKDELAPFVREISNTVRKLHDNDRTQDASKYS